MKKGERVHCLGQLVMSVRTQEDLFISNPTPLLWGEQLGTGFRQRIGSVLLSGSMRHPESHSDNVNVIKCD